MIYKNSFITSIIVKFIIVWNFKFGFKGGGLIIKVYKFLFPNIKRYYLAYPKFGIVNISFLDFGWIRQSYCGILEERYLVKALLDLNLSFRVIWDIGANSGYLATELLLLLKPDYLILFEPNLDHEETLKSLESTDSRIRYHMCGLSDTEGTGMLHIPGEIGSGSSCASLNEKIAEKFHQDHCLEVRLETGDKLINSDNVPSPDLIILDVEGHEEAVITGLRETIIKKRPIIIFEHIFLTENTILKMIPADYSHHTICDHTGELLNGLVKNRGHNVILIPS